MAVAGKPLDDEELVLFIVTDLDNIGFNPIISAILAWVEPISMNELFTQLLAFKQRMDLNVDQPTPPLVVMEMVVAVTTVAAVQTVATAMVVAAAAVKWWTAGTALKKTSLSLKKRVQTLLTTTMV